jgi:2-polyprenyl-3-methyl-5-hydroxy-6-metoxy-1,4-benzoquinol methylase
VSVDGIHDRIASRFQSGFLHYYTRSKLSADPLYAAVAERLQGHGAPLVDIGCGIGLMEMYLRECGYTGPITGVDHDSRKIAEAQRMAASYEGLEFATGDAQDAIRRGSSLLLLDVLHYLRTEEQQHLLASAADAVPPGGVVVVRDAIRDGTWRYRITNVQEILARCSRWLRADRLNFPTRELIVAPFAGRDFDVEVMPLWGRTPFNNYLFVFRRAASGTVKV